MTQARVGEALPASRALRYSFRAEAKSSPKSFRTTLLFRPLEATHMTAHRALCALSLVTITFLLEKLGVCTYLAYSIGLCRGVSFGVAESKPCKYREKVAVLQGNHTFCCSALHTVLT